MSIFSLAYILNLSLALVIISFVLLHSVKSKKVFLRYQHFWMQREALKLRQEVREQTLKNISGELHDNVGQTLSLAKLYVNTIDPYDVEKTGDQLQQIKGLLTRSIGEVRHQSKTLDAEYVASLGWQQAVDQELSLLRQSGQYRATLDVEPELPALSNTQELVLFRILQECLGNIVRYARATSIDVSVKREYEMLRICIRDNGVGFDVKTKSGGPGGLHNMQQRSRLLGGDCRVDSSPELGSCVKLTVPIASPVGSLTDYMQYSPKKGLQETDPLSLNELEKNDRPNLNLPTQQLLKDIRIAVLVRACLEGQIAPAHRLALLDMVGPGLGKDRPRYRVLLQKQDAQLRAWLQQVDNDAVAYRSQQNNSSFDGWPRKIFPSGPLDEKWLFVILIFFLITVIALVIATM